jgi:16S rRNA (guanine966-N2)-methyltransferase
VAKRLQKQSVKRNELRIIGGYLRSRKISFPVLPSLRPTPNRVRETVFNWLAPYIEGACCLDLFAGSGSLSFEAISRGASYCLLLDISLDIVHCLNENKSRLQISNLDIIHSQFPYPKKIIYQHFDIVFLDPPFHQDYVQRALEWLEQCSCLKEGAVIYVESERDAAVRLPLHWRLLKDKLSGNVRYSLVTPL